MSGKRRVLLVHNIVAPYRFPLFRALGQHPDVELTIWFMAATAKNRRWRTDVGDLGFNYEILPNLQVGWFSNDLFAYIVNPTFPLRYAQRPFDVLISAGWLDFATQAGWFLSKLLKRKFVLWSESTAFEPSWRRRLARPLVETMVRSADAWIAVGARSRDYLVSLGAARSGVFTAYSTVDVQHFTSVSSDARRSRARLRAQLGIACDKVILFSGQFIERKGVRTLLDAFSIVKARYPNVALALLGYGPLKEMLALQVRQAHLADVHFLEHVEVDQIPRIYAAADILVLPSTEETWGLVVNEAMACGLPVVVSDRVGSSADLVQEGVNGFIVPVADANALAERLLNLVSDDEMLARFSEASLHLIQHFTPARAADAFAAAIEYACDHSLRQ
jgi:glycosyltransferase involved in cell wall biosynthesis